MTSSSPFAFDPRLDLKLERVVDVPLELVWKAWTEPEHLKKWFTPAPWATVDCEIDLRPGGMFRTVMRSPDGKEFPENGCYLEVVPMERIVFTNVMTPGFRPAGTLVENPDHPCESILFTAVVSMERVGGGTKYTATAIHPDESNAKRHEEMGFSEGWGTALDQLVAVFGENTAATR